MRRLTVNENPFLARIERQGELKNAHKYIIDVLDARFGEVPEAVQVRVRSIPDQDRLRRILRRAVQSDSISTFLERMD
jgi:ribosomal protein S28E/S33